MISFVLGISPYSPPKCAGFASVPNVRYTHFPARSFLSPPLTVCGLAVSFKMPQMTLWEVSGFFGKTGTMLVIWKVRDLIIGQISTGRKLKQRPTSGGGVGGLVSCLGGVLWFLLACSLSLTFSKGSAIVLGMEFVCLRVRQTLERHPSV